MYYTHTYTHKYINLHVYDTYIHIYTQKYTYTYIHIYIHTYIQIHCGSGLRSYFACRILRQHGFDCMNVTGGIGVWKLLGEKKFGTIKRNGV